MQLSISELTSVQKLRKIIIFKFQQKENSIKFFIDLLFTYKKIIFIQKHQFTPNNFLTKLFKNLKLQHSTSLSQYKHYQ